MFEESRKRQIDGKKCITLSILNGPICNQTNSNRTQYIYISIICVYTTLNAVEKNIWSTKFLPTHGDSAVHSFYFARKRKSLLYRHIYCVCLSFCTLYISVNWILLFHNWCCLDDELLCGLEFCNCFMLLLLLLLAMSSNNNHPNVFLYALFVCCADQFIWIWKNGQCIRCVELFNSLSLVFIYLNVLCYYIMLSIMNTLLTGGRSFNFHCNATNIRFFVVLFFFCFVFVSVYFVYLFVSVYLRICVLSVIYRIGRSSILCWTFLSSVANRFDVFEQNGQQYTIYWMSDTKRIWNMVEQKTKKINTK